MGTVTIIVLGIVAISVVGVLGDMVAKIAQSKARVREAAGNIPSGEIEALKDRLAVLEARIEERDESVRSLQDEVRFVTRMLEDKSGSPTAR
jgi:folylpolyglutamate synthase/dihydropteroate synthase